jgi:Flp pilus assembly protein CpaB
VAKRDLAAGQRIDRSDLALIAIDLPATSARRAFRSISEVVGASTSAPLGKGELLQVGALVPAGKAPGFREVTIPVDGVQSQAVVAGDTVDVLVTTGNADSARTDVVVSGARVLRLGARGGSLGNDKPSVTFAVADFAAVTRMVQAAHAGSLTLVRANGFPAQAPTFSASTKGTP